MKKAAFSNFNLSQKEAEMAAAKGVLTAINLFMIIELIATYPRSHYELNENTLYAIRKSEANKLVMPAMKTGHNYLNIAKHLHETNGFHHITNPIDQMLITYAKAFIRDSLKVIQNKLKNATGIESDKLFEILLKIKNLTEVGEALVARVLYNTLEIMNELNADLTFYENTLKWMETTLEHFEQILEQKRLGAHITDVYETLCLEDDIEQNFDAVKMFWLKL